MNDRSGAPAARARTASLRAPQRERAGVGPREHRKMMTGLVGRMTQAFAACAVAIAIAAAQAPIAREVCVTFDDLPIAGVVSHDGRSSRAITAKLLGAIAAHHIPAIGFVNEGKLAAGDGVPRKERVGLLRMWLDAGLELGNHTYSHIDLNRTPPAEFEN